MFIITVSNMMDDMGVFSLYMRLNRQKMFVLTGPVGIIEAKG